MQPPLVDTGSLITIFGLIAAVWALVPGTSRLRLEFSLNRFDRFVLFAAFFLINYLAFAPILQNMGLYYSLGPWKWGWNSASAIYLILLVCGIYFYLKIKFSRLSSRKIKYFVDLVDGLVLEGRYNQAVELIEPNLTRLISLSEDKALGVRLPSLQQSKVQQHDSYEDSRGVCILSRVKRFLQGLKKYSLQKNEPKNILAKELLFRLASSLHFVNFLAQSKPYFALELLKSKLALRSGYSSKLLRAFLDNSGSRLYFELENNQNLKKGNRLDLAKSNKILHRLLSNSQDAISLGMDRAVGEYVLSELRENLELNSKLNCKLGFYYEVGRFSCPINSSLTIFEIMVHEGIAQGIQDHMWLHCFSHFADQILKNMDGMHEDVYSEWPTPYHYLLYRIVSIGADWIEQSSFVDELEVLEENKKKESYRRYLIAENSIKMLGNVFKFIVESSVLSDSFKRYLLEALLRRYKTIKDDSNLAELNSLYLSHIAEGRGNLPQKTYPLELKRIFDGLDHVLRNEVKPFAEALKKAANEVR
ncbi:MAG TPA: hypothetical protein VIG45_01375 [Erysipelothrix sp.]